MKHSTSNLTLLTALASWTAGLSILAVTYGFAGIAIFSGPVSGSALWKIGATLTAFGTIVAMILPLIRRRPRAEQVGRR